MNLTLFDLDGTLLPIDSEKPTTKFQRLMVAQDTGGAIKGAGRGDIYVGSGAEAGRVAGSMQLVGRMVALRPKAERG